MKRLFLFLIRVYKKLFSPVLGRHCRFWPTCSDYTAQAIEKYGAGRGLLEIGCGFAVLPATYRLDAGLLPDQSGDQDRSTDADREGKDDRQLRQA